MRAILDYSSIGLGCHMVRWKNQLKQVLIDSFNHSANQELLIKINIYTNKCIA